MSLKSWIITGGLFLTAIGIWGTYILSSRAFLRDFNGGVHAYLAGNYLEAENQLTQALRRRPRNKQVKQLLVKTLIERSFAQYHKRDFAGALETLHRADQWSTSDPTTQNALATLREQLATPVEKRPVPIEQVLADLYRHLPERDQPHNLQAIMEQWVQKSEQHQQVLLKHFSENQERWLVQLERAKTDFKRILYGGFIVFSLGALVLIILLIGVLHTYFGRRGIFPRLLEEHYQRLLLALPAGSQVLLGPPVSLLHVPEAKQMDAIEAELVSGIGTADAHRDLESLLEGENPWVRARAAKILYRINPKLALNELKQLIGDAATEIQVPGMWALSELATSDSLDLLAPMAVSTIHPIQQGAIRSLLQIQSKPNLPIEVRMKLNQLLADIRSRTGWIF